MNVIHYVWSKEFGGIERLVLDLLGEQVQDNSITPALLFGKDQGAFASQFDQTGVEQLVAGLSGGFDRDKNKRSRIRQYF